MARADSITSGSSLLRMRLRHRSATSTNGLPCPVCDSLNRRRSGFERLVADGLGERLRENIRRRREFERFRSSSVSDGPGFRAIVTCRIAARCKIQLGASHEAAIRPSKAIEDLVAGPARQRNADLRAEEVLGERAEPRHLHLREIARIEAENAELGIGTEPRARDPSQLGEVERVDHAVGYRRRPMAKSAMCPHNTSSTSNALDSADCDTQIPTTF